MSSRRKCSRSRAAILVAAGALVLEPSRVRAQEVVRRWYGDHVFQLLGEGLRVVGDVNADGFIDLGIAAPGDNTAFNGAGMLRVVSGADGAVLWTWYGDQAGAYLGSLGDALGDLDGDGFDDVLTSEPYYFSGTNYHLGRVFVFSGKDGSILLQLDGTTSRGLGGKVCGIGDVDGDSVPDFAVGDWLATRVTLISGATGTDLRTLQTSGVSGDEFGVSLANAGDIDGDLVPDLLVTETDCNYNVMEGCYAFSGATGSVIWQNAVSDCSASGTIYFGYVLRVVGDLNGDGIADWCTGASSGTSGYSPNNGYALCYSGKDGSFLFSLSKPSWLSCLGCQTNFGDAVAPVGDANGDGVPDVAVSDISGFDHSGGDVFVFSGVDGTLLFDVGGHSAFGEFGYALDGGVDVDGDGRLDLFASEPWDPTNGNYAGGATQFRISELILDATPDVVGKYGTWMQFAVNGGPPGNLAGLFLVDVNGTPQFALLQLGTFDAFRRWSQFLAVNPALTGTSVTLRSYAVDANGRVVASNDETLTYL